MRDPGDWNSLAERRIRETLEEGVFNRLEGSGKPISLEEDPFEPPDVRMAHRLLKNNGFAAAWIEEGKDLDGSVERLRQKLATAWRGCGEPIANGRKQLLEKFGAEFAELNRRILTYNLKAPSLSVPKLLLDANREIELAAE